MNLLLDTHIFLWYVTGDRRLSASMENAIRQPENCVLLSAASMWECLVKHRLGKLPLPEDPASYLVSKRQQHSIGALSIDEASLRHLEQLPDLHRDPFDRILICQAIEHDLTILTVDETILQYPNLNFFAGH